MEPDSARLVGTAGVAAMHTSTDASESAPGRAAAILAGIDSNPTLAAIAGAARSLLPRRAELASMRLRAACLASFTFEPIRPSLELQALRAGIDLQTYVAPYDQAEQQLIDSASALTAFAPDVVIVALRLCDACPSIYDSYNDSPAEARRAAEEWLDRIATALRSFRPRSKARILLQNCETPEWPALGIADASSTHSQVELIRSVNERLASLAREIDNMYVMDYDALVALHGRRHWTDRRMALLARMPIAPAHHWALAGFYLRHLRPLVGLGRKVLVLDADHTLWGGEIGDVGVEGIQLGPDFPGNAFVLFQRRILDLHRRGVVLCIASKNQPGIVEEALKRHPAMVLRPEHFASVRANWAPKPDNLREIAAELNLGLDSFVFVDDNPVECDLMRAALPQVQTVRLTSDPAGHAAVIESLDCFDQWSISEEDRQRGELYRAEAGRRGLQATVVDMPTFYRRLGMRLMLHVDDPLQIARIAQMTQRTNQFNMNAIRCTEDDIRQYVRSATHMVVAAALADRFGDSGVVGAAIIERRSDEWVLRLFLMSCRVLGRTVEQCLVKWIGGQARAAGAERLVALFSPTEKNKPFADFFACSGLRLSDKMGTPQEWVWALDHADLELPDWIEVVEPSLQK